MTYFDIARYSRKITTSSPDAQLWFDRGLGWTHGFSHDEAVECYKRALEADPDCAMAHWGVAFATGPNYNVEWRHLDERGQKKVVATAHAATQAALALAGKVTPEERALIEALPARYPRAEPAEDMRPWNDAFANAMRKAHEAFPDDIDIASLFVEAMMDRTPWKMWDLKSGEPAEGADTVEARKILEHFMETRDDAWTHPGILHLYVHLMEMSPFPEKALRAGDVLRELVPDSGHLIHMPTHIDVQCGHYRDVLYWNLKGVEVDTKFYEKLGPWNRYTGYRLHNYHFAIYGAMFLGQFAPAMKAAEDMVATVPEDMLRCESPPWADFLESYVAIKPHVQIRFGKWRELTEAPLPGDHELYCYQTALLHYAKGVAHAALGEVAEAERQRDLFHEARARVPDSRRMHNNICQDLLHVADAMLDGEVEYRKRNFSAAFDHLREAVARDDGLHYDEPWGWMQPTRHALGALLLEQGDVDGAEQAYREDLGLTGDLPRCQTHPDNIWALKGLNDCLKARGATGVEATLIRQKLDTAAARADIPVDVSCFCAGQAA